MLWFKKKTWKVKNTLLQGTLQNILENRTFWRTRKFITTDFYKMDLMKGIVILVKKDETYNILKSLLATRYCSRNERGIGWSKFLLEPASSMFICLLRPCFIKEQVSSPCHNFLLHFFHKIRITNVTLPVRYMLKFNPWNPKGALFWWCLRGVFT